MLHTSVPLPTQGLATRERGLSGPDDELIVLDGDDDELIVLDGDGAAGPVVRENPTSSPPATKSRATRRRSLAPPAFSCISDIGDILVRTQTYRGGEALEEHYDENSAGNLLQATANANEAADYIREMLAINHGPGRVLQRVLHGAEPGLTCSQRLLRHLLCVVMPLAPSAPMDAKALEARAKERLLLLLRESMGRMSGKRALTVGEEAVWCSLAVQLQLFLTVKRCPYQA